MRELEPLHARQRARRVRRWVPRALDIRLLRRVAVRAPPYVRRLPVQRRVRVVRRARRLHGGLRLATARALLPRSVPIPELRRAHERECDRRRRVRARRQGAGRRARVGDGGVGCCVQYWAHACGGAPKAVASGVAWGECSYHLVSQGTTAASRCALRARFARPRNRHRTCDGIELLSRSSKLQTKNSGVWTLW